MNKNDKPNEIVEPNEIIEPNKPNDLRQSFTPYCNLCNFQSRGAAEWIRHIKSSKHLRNGEPKTKQCDDCNRSFANHFMLKIHKLTFHSSKEERSKHKYYCEFCDYVFISQLFYQRHCDGKQHKNIIIALESLKK